MQPNYGKITRYEDVPITVPEQRQLRQPGLGKFDGSASIIEKRITKEAAS